MTLPWAWPCPVSLPPPRWQNGPEPGGTFCRSAPPVTAGWPANGALVGRRLVGPWAVWARAGAGPERHGRGTAPPWACRLPGAAARDPGRGGLGQAPPRPRGAQPRPLAAASQPRFGRPGGPSPAQQALSEEATLELGGQRAVPLSRPAVGSGGVVEREEPQRPGCRPHVGEPRAAWSPGCVGGRRGRHESPHGPYRGERGARQWRWLSCTYGH